MKTASYWAIALVFLLTTVSISGEIIGGSALRSPPQFMSDSFFGLTPSLQRAFLFDVISGEEWIPERLEVAAYHYENMAGSSATFVICSNDSGVPGTALAAFSVSDITTEQTTHSFAPFFVRGPLQGDTSYWLVGLTTKGQVNWNLEWNTGSFDSAYRVNEGEWILQPGIGNSSAFALIGSAVPEPSSLVLLSMGVVGLFVLIRRVS